MIYRQIGGIPIGSDCSQDLANLFLFSYESEFVENLISHGKDDEAEKLGNCSRYIDDLAGLNDDGYISEIFCDMYPEELTLNQTNSNSQSATYLDMNITVRNGKFHTSLYDKRNEFGFKVISLPHMSSNVPMQASYAVYCSQITRLMNANSEYEGFTGDVNKLTDKLVKQGYLKHKLDYHLHKFLKEKFDKITFKFWVSLNFQDFQSN